MKIIKYTSSTSNPIERVNLIGIILFLLLISSIQSCKNENQIKKDSLAKYQTYITKTNQNIAQLPKDKKTSRLTIINKLKATESYKMLVDSSIVSVDYLPIITLINNGLRSTFRDKNGGETMSIDQGLIDNVKNTIDGEDRLRFTINAVSLSAPNKGGFPKELIQLFDNYIKKYGSYGQLGKVYISDGKTETLPFAFDISSIQHHLNATNQNLNSIYEANRKGISNWLTTNTNGEYIYPYMATKKEYLAYSKEVNPNSPYTLKVDSELTAKYLYKEYEANEVLADENYKGKKIAVSGIIGEIGKDIFDKPYVSLKVAYLQGVHCYFDDDNIKIISKLKKGQRITIIGTCNGLTLTDVIIKDCEIWED